MASINPLTTNLANLPARAAGRFKASMGSSTLVGPGSAAVRFAKIQWLVIFWRCLILTEVVIMAAACPSCYFPLENALLILFLGLAQTLAFSWLRVNTSLTSTWPFYFVDFALSMFMMILARDGTLIMVVSFYATTALFVRPMVRFSQAMALSGLAGGIFLTAMYLASPTEYSVATIADYALIFLLWGFGWMLACRIIDRAAVLETDMYLEEQRRSFRRRLHDDLGNTLCGLHFKIQSLFRTDRSDMGKALSFLAHGYGRAGMVLDRILSGIEAGDECDSIEELNRMAEQDFGVRIHLTGDSEVICLSPAVKREVFSLLREALANSAKHAGTGEATVCISRCRRRLEIKVTDQGGGFTVPAAGESERHGGLGLRNMIERAASVGARLDVKSQTGAGTQVILSLNENEVNDNPGGQLSTRLIDSDTYLLLMRIKVGILMIEAVQILLGGSPLWSNPAAQLVAFLLTAESITWFLFRRRLQNVFSRHPWWLILDILFFCLLYFISWRAGIPIFIAEAMSMSIFLSAWFLGASRNFIMSLILGSGLLSASALAPPDATSGILRQEELFIEVMDNIIIGTLAGIAFEFIRSINTLRAGVVDIALERHRAAMSAETHRGLYQLVESIKQDVSHQLAAGNGESSEESHRSFITSLETRSTLLKYRLRVLLAAIDKPDSGVVVIDCGETNSDGRLEPLKPFDESGIG